MSNLGRLARSFVALSLVTVAEPARAEPNPGARPFSVVLEYAAPPGCPDAGEIQAIVSKRLGYAPFVEAGAPRVLVLVSRGEALEGRIVWRDAAGNWNGEQTFPSRSNDCSELVLAMGFALAVQIELLTGAQPSESAAPGPAPPASSQPLPHKNEQAPEPRPLAPPAGSEPARAKLPAASRWKTSFAVGAGADLGFGLAPKPDLGLRVLANATVARVSFELAGEADLPTLDRRQDGAGFSERYALASLAICGHEDRIGACGVFRAGSLRVSGREIDRPVTSSAPLLQTGVRLIAAQPLSSRLFLAARVEGLVNLTRWTVRLDQLPVWSAPRFAGLGGLDLGVVLK